MIFGSVCSGIGAPEAAWTTLGWRPAFMSEIEKFPRAVLAHHYPEVPLHGDFTTIQPGDYEPIDLLVGGTPCQSFSVAGLRGGLADDRGNLALEYLRLADRLRPRWLVWENVPGVLSSNGGRDFGAILGGMGELGYGVAYRVLDAQFFGVAQRRRRVFVVGYLGDWRRAAGVLFERQCLSGDAPPRRDSGQAAADDAGGASDGPRRVIAFGWQNSAAKGDGVGDLVSTLDKSKVPAIALELGNQGPESGNRGWTEEIAYPLLRGQVNGVAHDGEVRKLTPRECERLQGFPDDYTLIPWRNGMASDGPRYKALGNSMAVPVMRWIGERIEMVDKL